MSRIFVGKEAEMIVNLSYNIRYTIMDNNTSIAEVSRKSGVSTYTIRGCIRGQVLPSDDDIEKIANALGCKYDDLIKPYDHSMRDSTND